MKQRSRLHFVLSITAALLLSAAFPVSADDTEVEITPFFYGVSEYYGIARDDVLALRHKVAPDEVPVVLHIADHAGVSPAVVVGLRTEGHSWREVSHRLGVAPETYYVPVEREPGPPYGKAWGYYRNKPRAQWKEWRGFELRDEEIVDLVNLRFISDHYDVDRHRVIEMRQRGHDHVTITRDYWPYDFRRGHRPGAHGTRDHPSDHARHHGETDRGHGSDHRGKGKHKDKDKKGGDGPPRF